MKRRFKKYNSENELGDFVYRAFVLICRKCTKMDTHIIDQVMTCKADASRLYERRGWKVIDDQVLCPDCCKADTDRVRFSFPLSNADDYLKAIKWALANDRHIDARDLAQEGASIYSTDEELQKYWFVLQPPKTAVSKNNEP